MTLLEDVIVDIPPERVKFFGTTGKMLLPSAATVAALLENIPAARLVTTNQLRQSLTKQFTVQGTCPVTTRKALKTIAHDASYNVPYWRVVNQNGGLITIYPGGAAAQAVRLTAEGFVVEEGKNPRVQNFSASLANLD